MARLGVILLLAVGILSAATYGYELPSAISKGIFKAMSTEKSAAKESESDELPEDELKIPYNCRHDGFFAHPRSCRQYIHCLQGRAVFQWCPPGLHFNKKAKRCDIPCNAKCDPTIACERKSSESIADILFPKEFTESKESSNKVFTLKLKFVCFDDGLFPNPNDCNKYINCSNGISHDLRCPLGLHFNSETIMCESPCSAKCDLTLPCKWRTFKKTVVKESVEELCSKEGVYKERNPLDCGSYFRCENGDALLFYCDESQHFNPENSLCDEPCNARCDPSIAEKCGWEDTSETENADSLKQPIFDFSCVGNGLYENPHACENFIQCIGGNAYLINCPYGQHFNSITQRCTSPCEAKCDPNYENFCKDDEKYYSPKQLLKDFDCETDGYHVNPIDCESFIQCFRGSAYTIYCPAGLHYSPTLEICMAPCDAKCAPNYEDYCRAEERNSRRRPQLPGSESAQQPFPLVPEFICTEDGLYQNPEECTSYIECMKGQNFIRLCPEGLHFSEKMNRCVSPCEAHCDFSMGASCGWDESWSSTENSQDFNFDFAMFFSPSSPGLMYHFTCMKDGIYKNPENCSSYIQCAGGHSYVMECPEGLHFSEKTWRCDYPCEARCDARLACGCEWENCDDDDQIFDELDCEAEPAVGPCTIRLPRYYYDALSGRCRGFYYGGCEGNSNNFKSMEECENKCQKKLLKGFECPVSSGKFGHYPDCVSYYHCKRGIPILKKCPTGTAFDYKKSKCVTEYEATCVYECRDKDAVYPYEEDCRKYIDCVNGISKLEKCPERKAFDPQEKDCVDEKQVSSCSWPTETEN